jgi:hypothetical protein
MTRKCSVQLDIRVLGKKFVHALRLMGGEIVGNNEDLFVIGSPCQSYEVSPGGASVSLTPTRCCRVSFVIKAPA